MSDATTRTLGIIDRLIIPTLLPREGGLVTQRVVKDIRKKTQLSQEEMTSVNMRDVRGPQGQSSTTWDTEKTEMVDGKEVKVPLPEPIKIVEFTEAEMKMISDGVKKLDSTGKINQENLSTCEKFLEPGPELADTPEETA